MVLDIRALATLDLLDGEARHALEVAVGPLLNPFMAMGNGAASALRAALSKLLCAEVRQLVVEKVAATLIPQNAVRMHVPAQIGGFTDFFTSRHHASRAGRISRPSQPLPPAFRHMPMAYNGRASAVRVSGIDFPRPWGVLQSRPGAPYRFGPSEALDFELEVGAYVGKSSENGMIPVDAAHDHLFGFCLPNDWSSRDIQRAESFPLGPFLAKSSMTSVSPWIVTADALIPFRVSANEEAGDQPIAPHLLSSRHRANGAFALSLTASISTPAMRAAGEPDIVLTRSDLRNLYWTFEQMIAHHASGGCPLEPGDLLGSGTVSGPGRSSAACLYELCIAPDAPRFEPITLPNGEQRQWLLDGDEIVLRGRTELAGFRQIGFGECRTRIQPARDYPANV